MPTVQRSALLDTVAFCDPAGGKENKDATKARSAIVVVSQDAASRVFVRHVWAERCSTERLLEQILWTHTKFLPRPFGIEANAQQSLFVDMVAMYCRERGVSLPILPFTQPTSLNKDFRIRSILQPVIGQGLFFMGEGMELLEKEIKDFPMSSLKDAIDACASAIALLPRRRSLEPKNHEAERHLAYLRDTGAPPDYIQRVARQYELSNFTTASDISSYLSKLRS